MGKKTGWWLTYPLKNMKVNGKDYPIYIYIMENIKCLKPPTRNMATGFDVCNQTIDGFAGPSS